MKKNLEEQVVQRFPHRCPYCDQPVDYDQIELQEGENLIECRFCQKSYIKVVGLGEMKEKT